MLKRQKVGTTVLGATGIALAAGIGAVYLDRAQAPTVVSNSEELAVEVSGSVKEPGVYFLPEGSRVADALSAAGGLTSDADPSELNQAARLLDEVPVNVPSVADTEGINEKSPYSEAHALASAEKKAEVQDAKEEASAATPDAGISINDASQSELESLPGIGPVKAQAIIAYRQSQGGFATLEELMDVKGIGEKTLAKLRPYIRL